MITNKVFEALAQTAYLEPLLPFPTQEVLCPLYFYNTLSILLPEWLLYNTANLSLHLSAQLVSILQ